MIEALDDHGPADTWRGMAGCCGEMAEIRSVHGRREALAELDSLQRAGIVEREGRALHLA